MLDKGAVSGTGSIAGIIATIGNCSFDAVSGGCSFDISGGFGQQAYGNVQILGNLFQNVTNTAIALTSEGLLTGSSTVINNIFVNASNGVVFQDPWDAKVQDSIFVGCTNAAQVLGKLSRNVSYNDFFAMLRTLSGIPPLMEQ